MFGLKKPISSILDTCANLFCHVRPIKAKTIKLFFEQTNILSIKGKKKKKEFSVAKKHEIVECLGCHLLKLKHDHGIALRCVAHSEHTNGFV